jgi:hypothetical protein
MGILCFPLKMLWICIYIGLYGLFIWDDLHLYGIISIYWNSLDIVNNRVICIYMGLETFIWGCNEYTWDNMLSIWLDVLM